MEKATFAGGCFWCMQPPYDQQAGVLSTEAGYMGGTTLDPTYEQVCSGTTGHAEVIQVTFDAEIVNYETLLEIFWKNIDPTTLNRQFADQGTQYRTAIFYHNESQHQQALASKDRLQKTGKYSGPIVTEIAKASRFYPAENYHQQYYKKNSLHYEMYKHGSGRAGYVKKMWGDQH
ncbi:MAG: peptide-methionine (S)-S-oxide reductase MsrA [SAR324 cluster bacterium]|nr:peptide-methionine (S)-S-oxide reductase MsrA [SAR324 cluster bacterium]